MDYIQDPNNVAARRSSSSERNKWFGPDLDADDLRSPDEVQWRAEVAARAESLGPAVADLVMKQNVNLTSSVDK